MTRRGTEQLLERALAELVTAFDAPHGPGRRRRIALAIRGARALVTPEPMLPSERCTVCGRPAHDCMRFDKAGEIVDPRCWAHLPGGGGDHG